MPGGGICKLVCRIRSQLIEAMLLRLRQRHRELSFTASTVAPP